MRKLFISLLVTFISISSFSQAKTEVDLMQALFGITKLEVVNAFVKPSEAEKEAFTTLYNEYETKRMELGKVRIALLSEYAEKWEGMTNEQADAWMKKVLDASAKRDKLIRTYYKKIKKATNAKVATQFYQIETYILTSIRLAVYENIPFVGEKI